jgi:hypothetical protein
LVLGNWTPWGPGASERYFEFSCEIDRNEGRRHVLGMRVCENARRFVTNVAVGRGSPTVDVEDSRTPDGLSIVRCSSTFID